MSKPYPIVISAFPGTGKTYATERLREAGYIVSDSDSSLWPKENFPANYINHLLEMISDRTHDVIFVSSHDVVRSALHDADIFYTLMYPHHSAKEEYLRRYKGRGSPDSFIDLIGSKWDEWIDAMDMLEYEVTSKPPRRVATYRMMGDGLTLSQLWPIRAPEFREALTRARQAENLD